jgi:hypothetical protein
VPVPLIDLARAALADQSRDEGLLEIRQGRDHRDDRGCVVTLLDLKVDATFASAEDGAGL